ncbi:MAG: hypothetical protein HY700_21985 [Gemmatimonadetes bacterium]|nr:hypothetical protein [Gemmatimonadota bacterium]
MLKTALAYLWLSAGTWKSFAILLAVIGFLAAVRVLSVRFSLEAPEAASHRPTYTAALASTPASAPPSWTRH